MGVNDFSNKDPNIGSARNASTDSFKTTLAVNLLIFVVIMALFFTVRRKNRRIYAPLTCVCTPYRRGGNCTADRRNIRWPQLNPGAN